MFDNEKNKTFICNYWWNKNNYGAILTAYALNMLIPDSFLVEDVELKYHKLANRKYNFSAPFVKKYLSTKNLNNDYKNLIELNKESKFFITGSDQVFRVGTNHKERRYQYLLDFVDLSAKKVAFSASFGFDKDGFIKEAGEEAIEWTKISLKSFDFISVREKSGVEICRDLFDVEAEWIIDPVFILDKSKYDELIQNENKEILRSAQNDNNNYSDKVVAYVLDTNKEYKKMYKYLEKKYNKKVVETANSNISIESWLKSVRDCKLFITDSFHGMCFALIFNKPFICLANKSRGRARFDSICEMLGMENQCINSTNEIYERDCIFKVDYQKVNKRIEEEKQKGINFLKKALEAPITKTQEKIVSRMRYLEKRVSELEKTNNLLEQLKKCLLDKCLIVYYCVLRIFIKKFVSSYLNKNKRSN